MSSSRAFVTAKIVMCVGAAIVCAGIGCGGGGEGDDADGSAGSGGTGGTAQQQDGGPPHTDASMNQAGGQPGLDGSTAGVGGAVEPQQIFVNGMLPVMATKNERVLVEPMHGAVESYYDGRFVYYAHPNYSGPDTFTLGTGAGAGTPTRRIDVKMVEHPISDPVDDGASAAELMGGDALLLPGDPEAISGNGRYIVFSNADGRVSLHDRHSGTSKVVSLDAFGAPIDGRSADISRGGRYVAYSGDKGVCVFDQKDDVRVCLRNLKGKALPNQALEALHVSANGRYVVLTVIDTEIGQGSGFTAIALWDVQTGELTNLTKGTTAPSNEPDISGDGRYVVFHSEASLEPADVNKQRDVYLLDRSQNKVVRILNSGAEWKSGGANNARISPSGKTVVFGGNITTPAGVRRRAFYYDVATGTLSPVMANQAVYTWAAMTQLDSLRLVISGDDKWMVFTAMGSTENAVRHFRMNLETHDAEEVTRSSRHGTLDISIDGRYAMFPQENSGMFRTVRFATP